MLRGTKYLLLDPFVDKLIIAIDGAIRISEPVTRIEARIIYGSEEKGRVRCFMGNPDCVHISHGYRQYPFGRC